MRHAKSSAPKPQPVDKPSAERAKSQKQIRCPNCGIPFTSNTYGKAQDYLDQHLRRCKG